MADKYKVTYFNITGYAEPIRFLLSYAGAEFEDNRISKEDWPALKETLPFKKLPILEVNDKILHQSVAICRYLGQKFDLEHEDPWTRAELEALLDNLRDLQKKLGDVVRKTAPNAKQEFDEALEQLYKELEPLASQGCFYGSQTTWVDIYFAGFHDTLFSFVGDVLKPYPNLMSLVENVKNNEGVSSYLKTRPHTEATP